MDILFHLLSIIELGVWVLALISVAHYGYKRSPEWGWVGIALYLLFTPDWLGSMDIFSQDGILGMIFPNLSGF